MTVLSKKHKKNPLVSVVILTRPGNEKLLLQCLKSVKSSSYQNLEIVLVVNGFSLDLNKKSAIDFNNLKIIRLIYNTGCFGFNVGYANSLGKYVLSLDDDVTISSKTIGRIVDSFEKEPNNTMALALNHYHPVNKHFYYPPKTLIGFQTGGVVFKQELFDLIGYYDKDFFLWGESDDYTIRIYKAGYKIIFAKKIIVNHYEKNRDSETNTNIF